MSNELKLPTPAEVAALDAVVRKESERRHRERLQMGAVLLVPPNAYRVVRGEVNAHPQLSQPMRPDYHCRR